jgi:hypothetical protein
MRSVFESMRKIPCEDVDFVLTMRIIMVGKQNKRGVLMMPKPFIHMRATDQDITDIEELGKLWSPDYPQTKAWVVREAIRRHLKIERAKARKKIEKSIT